MYEDNIISREEAQKPPESYSFKKIQGNSKIYVYFIEEVRRQVIDKYEENALYKEGLHVIANDPRL